MRLSIATTLAVLTFGVSMAEAQGVLTIGRREDSTTFDPIKSAQNVDNWVFSNVFDVLVRVDKTGTKLEPGLAQSWTVSEDGLTYTFIMRGAKFSDGSPITANDAAYTLLRIRDNEGSLWSDSYKVIHCRGKRRQDPCRQAQNAIRALPVDPGIAECIGDFAKSYGRTWRGHICRKTGRVRRICREGMASR